VQSFKAFPLLPFHVSYRRSLLHLITHNDTYTLGRTPLDDVSTRCRDLYLHNTQHPAKRNIHARSGIRTRHPRKRTVPDLRPRLCGQRDLHSRYSRVKYSLQCNVPCFTFLFQSVFGAS